MNLSGPGHELNLSGGIHELFKLDEDSVVSSVVDSVFGPTVQQQQQQQQQQHQQQQKEAYSSRSGRGDLPLESSSRSNNYNNNDEDAMECDEISMEVDFYRNPTILSRLILFQKYENAIRRLREYPRESCVWVCAKRKLKPNPFHKFFDRRQKISSAGNVNESYSLRQLPIHIACACLTFTFDSKLRCDLELLIVRLSTTFPEGCCEVDHEGKLPLHEAIVNNASPQTISMLLMAAPKTLNECDKHGITPMELNDNRVGDNKKEVHDLLKLGVKFWQESREEANLRLKHEKVPVIDESVTSTSVMATSKAEKETVDTTDSANLDSSPVPRYDPFRKKFAPMEPEEIPPTAWEQLESRTMMLERILAEMYEKNYQLNHTIQQLEKSQGELLQQLKGGKEPTFTWGASGLPQGDASAVESMDMSGHPVTIEDDQQEQQQEEQPTMEGRIRQALDDFHNKKPKGDHDVPGATDHDRYMDTVVVNFYRQHSSASLMSDNCASTTISDYGVCTISDISSCTPTPRRQRFVGRNVSDLTASTFRSTPNVNHLVVPNHQELKKAAMQAEFDDLSETSRANNLCETNIHRNSPDLHASALLHEELETDDLSQIFHILAEKYDDRDSGAPSSRTSSAMDDLSAIFHSEAQRLGGGNTTSLPPPPPPPKKQPSPQELDVPPLFGEEGEYLQKDIELPPLLPPVFPPTKSKFESPTMASF